MTSLKTQINKASGESVKAIPAVAFFGDDECIQAVLDQIGIPWKFCKTVDAFPDLEHHHIWMHSGEPSGSFRTRIQSHLEAGGAFLQIGGSRRLNGLYIRGSDGDLLRSLGDLLMAGKIEAPRRAGSGLLMPGGVPVIEDRGNEIFLPRPPLARAWAGRLPFQFPGGVTSETVYPVDRGGYRRLITRALKLLFKRAGLPLATKSPHPQGKLPLLFRVDADDFQVEASEKTLALSKKLGVPFTWFIDVQRHQPAGPDFMRKLIDAGQEVQSHSWHHFTYRIGFLDRANIRNSYRILKQWGVETDGYCAPLGFWSPSLQKIFDAQGIAFSSEFAFAWDDLPIFPVGSRALQIPIHPICASLILGSGGSPDAVRNHFTGYIDRQLSIQEPILPYFHPISDVATAGPALAEAFSDIVRDPKVLLMTYSQYNEFWRKRHDAKIEISFDEDHFKIEYPYDLLIHHPDGRTTLSSGPGHDLSAGKDISTDFSGAGSPVDFDRLNPAEMRSMKLKEVRRMLGALKVEILMGPHMALLSEVFFPGRRAVED